jgi:CHAT domain-containing protein
MDWMRRLVLSLALASGTSFGWAAEPGQDAVNLARRAEAERMEGRVDAALAGLTEARRLAGLAGDRGLQASIDAQLAEARLAAGLAGPDLAAVEALLTDVAGGGDGGIRTASAALNTLGALREPGAAARAYRQSLDLAEAAGDHRLASVAAINAARAFGSQGAGPEAEAMLNRSAAALARMADDRDKAFLLVAQGIAARAVQEAIRQSCPDLVRLGHGAFDEAARLARALDDRRTLSQARGHMAGLYQDAGRTEEALSLTREAIFLAQEIPAPDLLFRWHWQAGRLLRAQGSPGAATAAYDAAVANLRAIRPDLLRATGGYGSPFRTMIGPLFLELADLQLRQAAGAADPAAAQRHLVAARDAVEQVKAAELEDYFQDDCVASLRSRVRSVDRIAPSTAVLYPILLPDRLELLVSLADGIRQVTVPVGSAEVSATAHSLRSLLEQRTTSRFLADSRRLYDWLVRPLEPILDGREIDTLVLVPDGPLRTIPLAALHDGRRFLVERLALAVTPGLNLVEPRTFGAGKADFLLAGLSQSVQGFPALPHVAAELSEIGALAGGTTLADRDFIAEGVRDALRRTPYTVVHLASHGKFEREAADSFILTFDGKLGMDQLERLVKLGQFRDEPVELLTLSACQTAAGDDRAALGLAGIAIKAGARSALASLWFINDQAASQLVTEFYRNLAAGAPSKAAALRKAQVTLLQDQRYRHPAYWAAFLLIGNWL